MIAIIQRVSRAEVIADGVKSGSIEQGYLVLLGVTSEDTDATAELLARKTAALRIFCDSEDKMNLSLTDIGGKALVVSNFTLCADTKKGNRPSFIGAMRPDEADRLYKLYCEQLKANGVGGVETGVFGADMQINMSCDGPVTITLNTDTWRK
ncbi:MAG: D-tyrosyl-tRNA(Tyr) deacylase [Clostridia bacterium]|nr:D-tyrosyl-tRNA(Tyr) deacylase [Clostridia bacterium]